jgi:hypothetical protein
MSVSDSRQKRGCVGPNCQRPLRARRVDWRPCLWNTLHSLAAASDPALGAKDPFWVFYATMPQLIPCSTCRTEWLAMSKRTPIHLYIGKPAVEVLRMTVDMHNEVNRRLGKPEVSFEQAKEMYI